jgi:hypothetical protein
MGDGEQGNFRVSDVDVSENNVVIEEFLSSLMIEFLF